MNTEEKAKAYDEMLQRVKELHESGNTSTKAQMEVICPELAESEDERIRKTLIDALKTSKSIGELEFVLPEPTREECIAYLEKQKYDRMKPVYDNQDSFESALEKAWKDYNDSGARTVDGCEDDYVECAHAKGFREGYLFGIEKQKEQKPKDITLSREDCLHQLFENGTITMADYLYLTTNRREQKPVPINPDDKHMLERIMELVEFCDDKETIWNWLCEKIKTAEQKPAEWKPQPESLEALMYAIKGEWEKIKPTSYLSRMLEDLYEGLVNTYNVDESLLAELPKVASCAYTAEDIEELREVKRKIEASMEQKPVEKQDYSGLNDLERAILRGFLSASMENVPVTIIKETAKECLAQMKPAEWSDEDKDMLNSCISSIEEAKENRYAYKETDGDTSYDHEIAWLKSLRPSWKPSEEQIRTLDIVISDYHHACTKGSDKKAEVLKPLFEQLKKLM